jgi:membrane associated rhomboid family serine protease
LQVARTDRQLVVQILSKLPWFSLVIILGQICFFMLAAFADDRSTLFSLQTGDSSGALGGAFDLRAPMQNLALNAISSFFVHADATHLYTNLVFALLVLIPLELRFGKLMTGLALLSGHLSGLLGAAFAFYFLSQPPLVAGMSGGLLAAAVPVLATRGKTFALMFLGLLCIGWIVFSWHSFASHALPIAAGWLLNNTKLNGKN